MEFIDLKAQYARIREDVQRRIDAVFAHGRFILGPEVAELEAGLARFVGVPHCIAVASGTDALLMAYLALDLKPGDEIITTPFSFAAAVEMALLLGVKPVYADIDPRSYNLDPAKVEAAITPRTRALVPVSLYGQCADFEALLPVAERHGLAVIEDAAQAFGATFNGRKACAFGHIATTSFFPAKPLGAYGDAGACFTHDAALAERLRELRVHGQGPGTYHHRRLGINGRLDTLQAAVLLAKLAVYPQEIGWRQAAAERYHRLLEGIVPTPWIDPRGTSVWAQYTVEVDQREAVREAMQAHGIPTAIHYPKPLPEQPAYRDPAARVPVCARAAQRVLSLPMHPDLTAAQQRRVVEALERALEQVTA